MAYLPQRKRLSPNASVKMRILNELGKKSARGMTRYRLGLLVGTLNNYFYQYIDELKNAGLIKEVDGQFSITDKGREILNLVK